MPSDTTVSERCIFASQLYRVDYFRAPVGNGRLLFTFTEGYTRSLDGPGFGGAFALESGFDLIAIKTKVDRFYQDMPRGALYSIEDFLETLDPAPSWRGGYGGSMGGFAAILFANDLELDCVLAISPQYDISQDWDLRWAEQNAGIAQFRPLGRHQVNPSCKYFIVYDPYDDDRLHVEYYKRLIPPGNFIPLRTPYYGHPSHKFLIDARCIKSLARSVLDRGVAAYDRITARAARGRMPWYFFHMAGHCARVGKYRWAEAAIARAVSLDPTSAEFLMRAADIRAQQRKFAQAVEFASAAVALAPEHPHMRAILARLLLAHGEPAQARIHIEKALAVFPKDRDFRYILKQIEQRSS